MVTITLVKTVFGILEQTHQPTMLELLNDYTPFQLLVMTMLSARTKDTTTIPIVRKMFAKYPQPEDYINMELKQIEKMIYHVGFHRVKAEHLQQLSMILIDKFQGRVPRTLKELITLPGVGRKTANCILNYAFHQPAIAVDVHVHRIANRMGWCKTATVEQTELQLQKVIPKEEWMNVNKLLVGHGQTICKPLKPDCLNCPVREYCNFAQNLSQL